MQISSRIRLCVALFIGLAVAVILVHPFVALAHSTVPNGASGVAGMSRKSVELFVALGLVLAVAMITDVFAPAVCPLMRRMSNAHLCIPISSQRLSQLPLLC
jgi:hypothetical protein